MARILITTAMFPEATDRLRAAGHEVQIYEGRPPREDLARAQALICPLSMPVRAELLSQAPALRIVANLGVGVDNIDLAAAAAHKVLVTNTPDVLTEATADLGWALLFAVARRIVEADQDLRQHGFPGWTFIPPHLGVDVYGKTLGVVGFGRIGQAVARRARGFAMEVFYHSRTRKPDVERELGARAVSLSDLLAGSDFVVLCVPLTPDTRHLIGPHELSAMKDGAILVNIARGPVVDEAALVAALKAGAIRGAGLDVFEEEPQVHPDLLGMRNVVLVPHIGSATTATRRKMADLACDSVLAALAGRTPRNLVVPNPGPRA
ncbi:TPA: D-glycerate dehydrogenase [Candidatus Acetothermia bacterium]|nr:D-glycerate dehydrogenase [Candidatus Acetothermia bacterium]